MIGRWVVFRMLYGRVKALQKHRVEKVHISQVKKAKLRQKALFTTLEITTLEIGIEAMLYSPTCITYG